MSSPTSSPTDYQKFEDSSSNKEENKKAATSFQNNNDSNNNSSSIEGTATAATPTTRRRKNTVVQFADQQQQQEEHGREVNKNSPLSSSSSPSSTQHHQQQPALPPTTTTSSSSAAAIDSNNVTNPNLAATFHDMILQTKQDKKDEEEFTGKKWTGVYVLSSVWCTLYYMALLFSCLLLRQTIHAAILIAAVAKPCVRRIKGQGLTNTMPQSKVVLMSAIFSAVLISGLISVGIMSFASESGLKSAREAAWVLHALGLWNPVDHPVNCALSVILNLLILLLCGVYNRVLGEKNMLSEAPEVAKRRRLHERIYSIRVTLGLAVAAFSRPSVLTAPFYILHVIVLASFCVKRTVLGKWRVLQTTFLITSVYSALYLIVFLSVQNDMFQDVLGTDEQLDPMWGLKWRDFEQILKEEFGLVAFICLHVLAVFDVLHTARRIHGRFALLQTEEAEAYVHDRILERVAEIRERARRKSVSKNSFAMTLFNALVDAFPILMLPVLVIVVNIIQNVPAFGILLVTIFGFVAPTFVFVPALPALYVACSFVIAYAFVSEVVGEQAAEWMALYLKRDKDYNRAINMLSLAVLSFCCTCWIFVFSLKKKQSTQKASAKTMSALLASKRQKLERALDVVEDRLHPLAVQFKSLCNPGSQCITREGFPAVIHVVYGVEPTEEETERIWNTLVLQSEENLGALEQQQRLIEQQHELERLRQQRKEHQALLRKAMEEGAEDPEAAVAAANAAATAASASSSPRSRAGSRMLLQNNSSFSAAALQQSFAKALQFFQHDDDEGADDEDEEMLVGHHHHDAMHHREEHSLSNLLIARSQAAASATSASPSHNHHHHNKSPNRGTNKNNNSSIPKLKVHDENDLTPDVDLLFASPNNRNDAPLTPSAAASSQPDPHTATRKNNSNNNNNFLSAPNVNNNNNNNSSATTPTSSRNTTTRKRGHSMKHQHHQNNHQDASITPSASSPREQQQQRVTGTSGRSSQQQQQQQAAASASSPTAASAATTSALATELLQEEETILMISHRARSEAIQRNRSLAASFSSNNPSPRNNNQRNNFSKASFFSANDDVTVGIPSATSFFSNTSSPREQQQQQSNQNYPSSSTASLHREETTPEYYHNNNNIKNMNNNDDDDDNQQQQQQNGAAGASSQPPNQHAQSWLLKGGNIGNTSTNFFATVMAAAAANKRKNNNNNEGENDENEEDPEDFVPTTIPPPPPLGLRFSGFLELHAEVAKYRMWDSNLFFVIIALIRDLISRNTESISLLIMFAAASYRSDLDCIRMIFILIFVSFLCFPSIRRDYWWVLIAYNILVILVLYSFSLVYIDTEQPEKIGLVDAQLLGLRRLTTPADLYVDFILLAVAVLQIRTRPGVFRAKPAVAAAANSVTFQQAAASMKKDFEDANNQQQQQQNKNSNSKNSKENNNDVDEQHAQPSLPDDTNNNDNNDNKDSEDNDKNKQQKQQQTSLSTLPTPTPTASFLNAPNLPLDTLKQILTDMEWQRLSRTAGTRAAKARLALVITVVCFIAVVVSEDQSALVAAFAITFVWKLRLLNTMPTSKFTLVINLGNTIYSVLALVAVSLFQFPAIRKWVVELVGSMWLCDKYGTNPEQCTSDVGFASAASKDQPATLTLLPWFVGCTSNIVLFTLSGAENEEIAAAKKKRKQLEKEEDEQEAATAAAEEEEQEQQRQKLATSSSENANDEKDAMTSSPTSILATTTDYQRFEDSSATTKTSNKSESPKRSQKEKSNKENNNKKISTKNEQQQQQQSSDGSISKTIASLIVNKDSGWISRPVHLLFTVLAFFGQATAASRVWLSHHGAKIVWLSLFIAGIRYRSCLNCVYIILLILDRRGWTCIVIGAIHLLIVYNYPLFFVPPVPLLGPEWERFLGFPKKHKENTLFAPVFVAVCSLIYLQAKKQAQVLKPTLPKQGMIFFANDKTALKRERTQELEKEQKRLLLAIENSSTSHNNNQRRGSSAVREMLEEREKEKEKEMKHNNNETAEEKETQELLKQEEQEAFDENGNLTIVGNKKHQKSRRKSLVANNSKSDSFALVVVAEEDKEDDSNKNKSTTTTKTSRSSSKKPTIHDLFGRPSLSTLHSLQSYDDAANEQEMKSLLHLQEGDAGGFVMDEDVAAQQQHGSYTRFDDSNNNNKSKASLGRRMTTTTTTTTTSSFMMNQQQSGAVLGSEIEQYEGDNVDDDDQQEQEEQDEEVHDVEEEQEILDRKRKLLRMLFPLEGSMMLPRNVLQHVFQLQYFIRRYFFSVMGYELILLLLLIGISVTTEQITAVFFFIVVVMLWRAGRHDVLTDVVVPFRCHVILSILLLAFTLLNIGVPPTFYDAPPMRGSESCNVKWWKYLGCDLPLTDEVFTFMAVILLRLAYLGADARRPLIDRPVEGCRTLGEYFLGKEQELIELRSGARDDAEAVLPPLPHDVLMSPRTLPESLVSLYFGFFPTAILAFFHGALQTSIVSIAEMLLGLCLIVYAVDIYWLFYRYWRYVTGFLLGLIGVQLLANLPPVSDWAFEVPNVANSIGVAPWSLDRVTTFSVVLQIAVVWSAFVQDRIFNEFFFAWKLQALHKGSILCYQRHQQLMVHMSEQSREQEMIAAAKEAQLVQKLEKIREERFGGGSGGKRRNDTNSNNRKKLGSDDGEEEADGSVTSGDDQTKTTNSNKNVKFHLENQQQNKTTEGGVSGIKSKIDDSLSDSDDINKNNDKNDTIDSSSSNTNTDENNNDDHNTTTPPKQLTLRERLTDIRRKIESQLTELILTAIDVLCEQSYTGRRPALHYHLSTRLLMALYKFAVRRTGDLCVLAFAINFAESGSIADMVLCVSGLIHALVVLPWSSESYWEGCLIYSVFGILIKSAIKICAENIDMTRQSKVAVSVLFLDLGVSSGDPFADVSQTALIDIVFDFFAFGSILLHRRMCVLNGVYVAGEERMKREEEEREQKESEDQHVIDEAIRQQQQEEEVMGNSFIITKESSSLNKNNQQEDDGMLVVSLASNLEEAASTSIKRRRRKSLDESSADDVSSSNNSKKIKLIKNKEKDSDADDDEEEEEDEEQQNDEVEDEEEEENDDDGQFVNAARRAKSRREAGENRHSLSGRFMIAFNMIKNDLSKVCRRLQNRLNRFLNELQGNIEKRSGSGRDFYTLYLTVDFLVLIYVTFGYYGLIGTVRGSFLEGLQQNLLPGPLVVTMLGLVISMIIDRIIYVVSHIRAKYLFHIFQAIVVHSLYIGWKIWFNSPHIASGVTLYFIKVLYLYVCCAQIRNGFAAHRRHDPFTEYATILYWFGHLIYRAVPFLFELRVLLDWSFARTALRLKAWWLVEDVHFWIYNRFTDIDDDRVTNPKRGSSFPIFVRVYQGVVLFLILIFVLFFPLMYYSTFNPNLVPNRVNSITARFSLSQVSEIYDSTSLGYDTVSDVALQNEISNTRPTLNFYNFNDDTRMLQLIELDSCSASLWAVSPYTRRKLLQRISQGIAKAESMTEQELYAIKQFSDIFFIDLSMRVIRFGSITGSSNDVTLQRRVPIPVYSLKNLYNIISRTKTYPEDETAMPAIATEMIRRNPNITQDVPADSSNSVWIPQAFDPFVFNRPTGVELFSDIAQDKRNLQGCLLVNYNFSSSTFPGASSSSSSTGQQQQHQNSLFSTEGETWCLRCSALFKEDTVHPVNASSYSCPSNSKRPCNFETNPPVNSSVPGPYFVSLSEPIPAEGGFLPNIGIIAIYTTFILTLFTILRRKVTLSSHRVTLEEVADPRPVAELVSYIYLTRSVGGENDLVLEELLYFELLDLIRSPESLLNLTGRRVEDYDKETEKYVRSIDVNF